MATWSHPSPPNPPPTRWVHLPCALPTARSHAPASAGTLSQPLCSQSLSANGCRDSEDSRAGGLDRWQGSPTRCWFVFPPPLAQLGAINPQYNRRTYTKLWMVSLSLVKPGWWCLQPKTKHPLPLGALGFILFKLHILFSFLRV